MVNLITIKLVSVTTISVAIVLSLNACSKEPPQTSRATYHNISKVEIKDPYSDPTLLSYDTVRQPEKMQAIVDEINSQSYGLWYESLGGKEGANAIGIHFYSYSETPVASFSLYPDYLIERGPNYRQLNAKGFTRRIDIKALPALKQIWCARSDISRHSDFELSQLC